MSSTRNPVHLDEETGHETGEVRGNRMGYSRRVVATLAVSLLVATAAAVGLGTYVAVNAMDKKSDGSTSATSMTAHMENALAKKPVLQSRTAAPDSAQSPWVRRYSCQYSEASATPSGRRLLSLPSAQQPEHFHSTNGAMLELKDFDGEKTLYDVHFEVRGDSPLGTFVNGKGNMDHAQLVIRIQHKPTGHWGFLVPVNFANRNVSRLADLFYFYADGQDGFVRTAQRSDLLLHESGRRVWDKFFVPYLQHHTTLIAFELARAGVINAESYEFSVPAVGGSRRLGEYGDLGRHYGSEVGGDVGHWAGSKVGSYVGSKIGGYAGGAIGGAIGAEVGGPIGYEIGHWAGSEVGSWAGGKIGGDIGGDLGRDWGGDAGGDLGQDAGNNFDDGSW